MGSLTEFLHSSFFYCIFVCVKLMPFRQTWSAIEMDTGFTSILSSDICMYRLINVFVFQYFELISNTQEE